MQYFKFDCDGNMYLYEPGSGINSTPHRVISPLSGDRFIFDLDKFCAPAESGNLAKEEKSSLDQVSLSVPWSQPASNEYNGLKFQQLDPTKVHCIVSSQPNSVAFRSIPKRCV